MMTPEERYLRDPEFHMLTDVIYSWIEKCQYTPTEVREAAVLAAIHYGQRNPYPAPSLFEKPHSRGAATLPFVLLGLGIAFTAMFGIAELGHHVREFVTVLSQFGAACAAMGQ